MSVGPEVYKNYLGLRTTGSSGRGFGPPPFRDSISNINDFPTRHRWPL